MFLLSKNYRGNFYALIFGGLIFLLVGCDGCSVEPGSPLFEEYESPCSTSNTQTDLLVSFPLSFAGWINSCMTSSLSDLMTLQGDPDDVYTSDFFFEKDKYAIQLNINGICESGEPFEQEFSYDDMDFFTGNLDFFRIPQFEQGDGSLTFRLIFRTPCATDLQSCASCTNSAMESIDAMREDVILGPNAEIVFDPSDFQVLTTACDCL